VIVVRNDVRSYVTDKAQMAVLIIPRHIDVKKTLTLKFKKKR